MSRKKERGTEKGGRGSGREGKREREEAGRERERRREGKGGRERVLGCTRGALGVSFGLERLTGVSGRRTTSPISPLRRRLDCGRAPAAGLTPGRTVQSVAREAHAWRAVSLIRTV